MVAVLSRRARQHFNSSGEANESFLFSRHCTRKISAIKLASNVEECGVSVFCFLIFCFLFFLFFLFCFFCFCFFVFRLGVYEWLGGMSTAWKIEKMGRRGMTRNRIDEKIGDWSTVIVHV